MIRSSVLLFIIIILPILSTAQFGYGKVSEITALQSRKLIVLVEQQNARVLKKLQKKDQQDKISMYNTAIENYNANMKKVAEKFWTFSKNGIEYKTFQETDALRKSGSKDYAVLYCVSSAMSAFNSGFSEDDGLDWTWNIADQSKDRDYFDGFTEMKVSTLEDLKSKPIFYVVLPDIFPTTTSIVNGMFTLQTYMDIRLRSKKDNEDISSKKQMDEWVAANNKNLKNKILLIRQDLLPKDFDKAKVAETYSYPFEIVSSDKLDSVIFNQYSKYVYALVIPGINSGMRNNQVYYMQAIFGADNNEVYAYSMPSMGGMMLGGSFGARNIGHKYIDSKTLNEFINPK